jgi:hypothetical protein
MYNLNERFANVDLTMCRESGTKAKKSKKVTLNPSLEDYVKAKRSVNLICKISVTKEFKKICQDQQIESMNSDEIVDDIVTPLIEMFKSTKINKDKNKKEISKNAKENGFYTKKYEPTVKYEGLLSLFENLDDLHLNHDPTTYMTIPSTMSILKKYIESEQFNEEQFENATGIKLPEIENRKKVSKSILTNLAKEIVDFVKKGK